MGGDPGSYNGAVSGRRPGSERQNRDAKHAADIDVGLFLVNGVADFGLAVIREVLNVANALRTELNCAPRPWIVRAVGVGSSVCSGSGTHISTTPVAALSGRLDLLVVPAVNVLQADSLIEMVCSPDNRDVLELIIDGIQHGTDLAAACAGTFFLAESGVLDGKMATTSWWHSSDFRRTHLDLALSLVNSQSPGLAELVTRYMLIGNRSSQLNFMIPEAIARGTPWSSRSSAGCATTWRSRSGSRQWRGCWV